MVTLHLAWPQMIWFALCIFGLGISVAKHGEPKGEYNAWHEGVNMACTGGLLWWGGFFG